MIASKRAVITNFAWRFLERTGAQGITFLVSVVLARALEPDDFGQVALITIFLSLMQVFVDSGLGSALVQKPDADATDFSTVFFFNIAMCSCMYLLLFLAAPSIARFYGDMSMTPMIRVIGITILISGVKNIQQAFVSRLMLFKKFFYATLGGTLVSGVVGVTLALLGAGSWAIIFQHLSNTFIDTVILWITVKWRPKKLFSRERFKTLFSFGWKLLVSSLLNTMYINLWQLIIGKRYTKKDLAFYNRGHAITGLIVTNVNASIGSVLFPALASEQHDPKLVKRHVRRSIQTSSYLMWPLLMGIAACAEPLIRVILSDKWLPTVPYLQISCFVFGLMPIHTANLQAVNAMGRSDLFLKMEIVKKVIGITALLLIMPYGVMAIAISLIFTDGVNTFINAWPNRKLLNYSYREQISDVAPSFLLSVFMLIAVKLVGDLHYAPFATLLLQVPFGALIYLGGSFILDLDSFTYVVQSIRILRLNFKKPEEGKKAGDGKD